jgi:hypothetical protein
MSVFRPRVSATEHGRAAVGAVLLLALAAAVFVWMRQDRTAGRDTVYEPASLYVEPGSMCPWRTPEEDLHRFFPGAGGYRTRITTLSSQRLELHQRLGRMPGPDENSLSIHEVTENGQICGAVLTRRVKAEHGLIEVMVAVDNQQRVRGLKLQRLREPESVAVALQDPAWLSAFIGKSAESRWALGEDIPEVPTDARVSAGRLIEAVRSLLVLFSVAEARPGAPVHH